MRTFSADWPVFIGCVLPTIPGTAFPPAERLAREFAYVALSSAPSNPRATDDCSVNYPGVVQAMCESETGPRGCSLIEVDEDGQVELTSITAAPVRWEQRLLGVDPQTTRPELVERMQFALLEREPSVGERLWLVQWQFVGSGGLFESLADDETFGQLCEEVEAGLGARAGLERCYRRELRPRPGDGAADDAVARQFEQQLNQIGSEGWRSLRRELQEHLRGCGLDEAAQTIDRIEFDVIREAAERSGREWVRETQSVG